MKQKEKDGKRRKISEGAASGATAIIFAIIGFQAAIVATRLFEPRPGPEPQTQTQTQMTLMMNQMKKNQKQKQKAACFAGGLFVYNNDYSL